MNIRAPQGQRFQWAKFIESRGFYNPPNVA